MSDEIVGGAVGIVLARMDSHPDEFFGNCDKWKFIYKDYFRDAMTETEKGMIFDRIKKIRMSEFSQAVLTTLVEEKNEEEQDGISLNSMAHPRGVTYTTSHQAHLDVHKKYKCEVNFKKAVKAK